MERVERGEVWNPSTLKRYLLYTRGNKCELCNGEPIHNGKELKFELNHIDGNSDNNMPMNIQLICPNCHSQLPTSIGGLKNKKFAKRNVINHLRTKQNLASLAFGERAAST